MAVVEIADAAGAIQKIDVQASGEGFEQLVADLGAKSALEAIRVLLEGNAVVKVTDNAGSLTVDASLASPVGVRLSDGTSALGTTAGRLQIDDGGQSISVDDNGGSLTVDGTVALGAGTAEVGKVKVTELPALILAAGTAAIGKVIVSKIEEALPAGTNNIGKVTVAAIEAGTNAIGKLAANAGVNIGSVGLLPQTTGGLEPKRIISAATTNATSVKASAGQVFGWYLFNAGTATRYVKLYNKASAPTVGTDTPLMTLAIPAGAAANVELTNGIAFGTGIALAITKGLPDANAESVAVEEVLVNLLIK